MYLFIYIFAGPSAQGRVGIPSLVVLSCCKSIFLSYCLGTQGPRNGTPARHPKSLLRPLGTPRPDFLDFFAHREGFKKPWFFGIAPKPQRWQTQSTPARPVSAKGSKKSTFDIPFNIDF